MQQVAENLEENIKYIEIYRNYHTAGMQHDHQYDPKFAYFIQCARDEELMLPVLQYVHKKTLCLLSYTLSIGHCKALAKACELFQRGLNINRVIFDNCGIDDEEFS